MNRNKFIALCVASLMLAPIAAYAAPVEIEASKQLEWLRAENKYRATGDVTIKQGDTVIRGNYAEALYDPAKGPSELTQMIVTGDVIITNGDRIIHAQKGVYTTKTETLVLDGGPVTLTSPGISVTAQQNMEYQALEHKAIARGNALIVQENKKLKADQVTAWFNAETNKMERAQADGHVMVTTLNSKETEIAQSQHATYNATKNVIELTGDVRLTRGQNHMQGDAATVDMATGHSTLKNTGAQNNGHRVRAIFNTGKDSPISVTGAMPVVNSKKAYEPAYAVGVKPNEQQSTTNPQIIKPLGR